MDFLSSADQVILVGNHARSLVSTNDYLELNSLVYEPGDLTEGIGGFLYDSKKTTCISCESYTPEHLEKAIQVSINHNQKFILFGDPSEWIVSAAITTYMQGDFLAAVFFIYPVGMAALDSRKELAQLILQLKSSKVPTYLLRKPELFFRGIEPNHSWFVTQLKEGVAKGSSIEYLCGLTQASEATIDGR